MQQLRLFENTINASGQKEVLPALASQRQEHQHKQGKLLSDVGVGQRRRRLFLKVCPLCQREFTTNTTTKKCCSPDCHNKFKARRVHGTLWRYDVKSGKTRELIRQCKMCSREFKTITKKKVYCTHACCKRGQYVFANRKHRAKAYISAEAYLLKRWREIKNQTESGRRHGNRKFTLSRDDLANKWNEQRGLCALTGFPMTHVMGGHFVMTNASVDRIDNNGPYSNNNTRLVCRMANHMKFQMTDLELVEWCSAIVRTQPPVIAPENALVTAKSLLEKTKCS